MRPLGKTYLDFKVSKKKSVPVKNEEITGNQKYVTKYCHLTIYGPCFKCNFFLSVYATFLDHI